MAVHNSKLAKKSSNDVNDTFATPSCALESHSTKVEVPHCLGVLTLEVHVLTCKSCERVGVETTSLVNNEESEIVTPNERTSEPLPENRYERPVTTCPVGHIEKFDPICSSVPNKMPREVPEKEHEKLEV